MYFYNIPMIFIAIFKFTGDIALEELAAVVVVAIKTTKHSRYLYMVISPECRLGSMREWYGITWNWCQSFCENCPVA